MRQIPVAAPLVLNGVTYYPTEVPLPVSWTVCDKCVAHSTSRGTFFEATTPLCKRIQAAQSYHPCYSREENTRVYWQTGEEARVQWVVQRLTA